jgi:molybdate transport system ATP-binding protein
MSTWIQCRELSSARPRYLEVRLAHVDLRRGGRAVLKDLSWTIRPGERWVLAGANGAGKTQLLKLVAGTVWPAPSARALRSYRRGKEQCVLSDVKEGIAYLGAERQDKYQRYGWDVAASRIVATGLYHTDIPLDALSASDRRRIGTVLRGLRATHLASRPFLSLSYGERRVILLARALGSRPGLVLLDEVLNGLDDLNRGRILRWLERGSRRLPWVLATHRLEDVPAGATHALVLSRGRIVYAGALKGAALERSLEDEARPKRGLRHRRRGPRGSGRALVRLSNARVYLQQRRVLEGISLTVRRGEWWVVHGRNGSGKTTLLRTLYGDHGVAVGGGIERAGVVPGVPLERFRKRVGLIAPHLQAEYPRELSVAEVVQSGRYASIGLNDALSSADRSAAQRALASFGLTRFATRPLGELSYGQARRVLFARAWVRAPLLLLLDEAFAGLDSLTRRALTERVIALAAGGSAVVATTHRPGEWLGRCTHELELAQGRALYCGPVRPLRRRPQRATSIRRWRPSPRMPTSTRRCWPT